jgi:hypothetical protein
MRRIEMKLRKLFTIAFLLVISTAALSAQNTLPNPNDDACWSSLSALRACQLQAYNAAMDQAQRCTSYPEYQCLPAEEPTQQKVSAKHAAKATAQTANTPNPAVSPVTTLDASAQTSNAK